MILPKEKRFGHLEFFVSLDVLPVDDFYPFR